MPSPKFRWNLRRRGWITLDLVIGFGAMLLAYRLQPRIAFGWMSSVETQPSAYLSAVVFPWFLLISSHVAGLHDPLGDRRRWLALVRICIAVVSALALFLAVLYASALLQLGRSILLRVMTLSVVAMIGARVVVWNLAGATPRKLGFFLSKERQARMMLLLEKHDMVMDIALCITPSEVADQSPESVAGRFVEAGIEEIVASSLEDDPRNSAVWLACLNKGVQMTDVTVFVEREFYKVPCDEITTAWLLAVDLKWNHPFYHRIKRMADISLVLLTAIPAGVLVGLSAIAILLDNPGPIFYSQTRTGFRGKPYKIWKLRTMRVDAERAGAQWASKQDARVTRVGRWLRLSRFDELPQFANVLLGHMSFIGPRPERPEFVEKLAADIPLFPQRHWVKPGITGWAQINYPYGADVADAREKLCYDLYYIKNASLLLDLHIALRTLGAMMKGSR